jgi:2,3-bisphosphoglycerate-independent phosphoglycerate mutase
MKKPDIQPVILTILDGWGHSSRKEGNAVYIANTPTIDNLYKVYPTTWLDASGLGVGLPPGQVGNSEVGHTSIGGGRVVPQDLVRIGASIQDNSFYSNKVLKDICTEVKTDGSKLHLIGLCSNGGVHSHITHLIALLDFLKNENIEDVCIHVITDGRDTQPNCAKTFINQITKHIREINTGRICTISGRYYAMDRDCRWTRTEAFYNTLVKDTLSETQDPLQLIEEFYTKNISDEFIIPTRIKEGTINNGDAIVLFNFRPDRMRQLVQSFKKNSFKGFKRKELLQLKICTFTQYDSTLLIPVLFKPLIKTNFLGEILAQNHLRQLRIAETEKYAHVTYFFNGGIEEPFPGEDRELIPSPQVKTYDESPEMSADQLTQSLIKALERQIYSLIVINYANPDMIGHTGNLSRTIEAIEIIDKCIANVLNAVNKTNSMLIITADHGNAECMLDKNQQPCKSHTTNVVPFIMVAEGSKIVNNHRQIHLHHRGSLADIAPTILDILNLEKPKEMTGHSLIKQLKCNLSAKIKI